MVENDQAMLGRALTFRYSLSNQQEEKMTRRMGRHDMRQLEIFLMTTKHRSHQAVRKVNVRIIIHQS